MSDRTFDTSQDPSWREAWWWFLIPVVTAVTIYAISIFAPEFYQTALLPEHTGYLERSHFFLPIAGFVIAARLLFNPAVHSWPLLMAAILFFAVSCFYYGMEEESWGQHLFKWETPDAWSQLNRQNETNLHNTSFFFNQFLQSALLGAVIVGGVLLPVLAWLRGRIGVPIIDILIPPLAILPTAITTLVFKYLQRLDKSGGADWLFRPSEATETFFSMFMLFYVVLLARRVSTLK